MEITHGIFAGQVLQRRKNQTASASVQGSCTTRGSVIATITQGGKPLAKWKSRAVGKSSGSTFTAKLDGIPVGGPYNLTLNIGDESLTLRDIFVGDVWLLAGQSNMQGCARRDHPPKPHPKVRAMYMDDVWRPAIEPIHFLLDSSDSVHNTIIHAPAVRDKLRKTATHGVGCGVYFGNEMVKRSNGVPQGLICTAHGGTSMTQWDPAKKKLGGASLYGSMLRMLKKAGQPIAGILWYQGESDAQHEASGVYVERMKNLVAAMRRDLKQPSVPFLLVQIGRVFGESFNTKPWNSIQNHQYELKRFIKNLDMVTTIDLPLDDTIHVGCDGMPRLGVRLARLADRMVYGNRREPGAPEMVSAVRSATGRMKLICPQRLTLTFKNVVGGFRSDGTASGFTFVDGNHRSQNSIFKTVLDGNKIHLETYQEDKLGMLQLMYGHGTTPTANITDGRDMAIPVFGPMQINPMAKPYTPYLLHWRRSRILPAKGSITSLAAPKPDNSMDLRRVDANDYCFVDNHLEWGGKSGQCLFFTDVSLSEPMKLDLLTGYDGPIKIWVDNREVFRDGKGTNPAVPDEGKAKLSLSKGIHRIAVAMDLNEGRAWGFFMRFCRNDVSKKRLNGRDFAVPECVL